MAAPDFAVCRSLRAVASSSRRRSWRTGACVLYLERVPADCALFGDRGHFLFWVSVSKPVQPPFGATPSHPGAGLDDSIRHWRHAFLTAAIRGRRYASLHHPAKDHFRNVQSGFLAVRTIWALLFNPNMVGCFYGVPCFSAMINTVELYPYAGLLPLMLALLALQRLRRTVADVIFWTIAVLAATILCLGLEPVQRVLYHVPIYNLFRAPGRHLFEVTFGICVLAAYGMDALLSRDRSPDERPAARRNGAR